MFENRLVKRMSALSIIVIQFMKILHKFTLVNSLKVSPYLGRYPCRQKTTEENKLPKCVKKFRTQI